MDIHQYNFGNNHTKAVGGSRTSVSAQAVTITITITITMKQKLAKIF